MLQEYPIINTYFYYCNSRWMGVTQFEQHGARRAFPCFDEPLFKAKFTISIAHAPEHKVLSNMPNIEEDPEESL